MDLLTAVLATVVGSAIGLVTGLVPGLHVNTLAAAALLAPVDETMVLGLVAVGVVHTFVSAIPSTYLGAAGEDATLSVLPAHRMLLAGDGPQAVHITLHASLLAVLAALPLLLVMKWILAEPGKLLPYVDSITPGVLVAVLVVLAWHRPTRAVPLMAAAAWLGLGAAIPMRPLVPVAGSHLLPLLAGLFGVPVLLAAIARETSVPRQFLTTRVPRGCARDALRGACVASWTAVLPAVTAATATAIARGRDPRPQPVLATLGAVNTAHAVLALGALWTLRRTRSGLADVVAQSGTSPWVRGVPDDLAWLLFVVVAAAVCGTMGTRGLDRLIAPRIHRMPSRALHVLGLVLIVAMVVVLTGLPGTLVATAATLLGLLPPRFGVRRVVLTSALLVPALL